MIFPRKERVSKGIFELLVAVSHRQVMKIPLIVTEIARAIARVAKEFSRLRLLKIDEGYNPTYKSSADKAS
jgi:hypothetical protein